jgi:tRNA acetyltransferase TAN1
MEEKVQNDYKNDDKNDIALQSKDKVDRNESKKEKSKKKNKNEININEEMKGFLIFTDKHREKNCIRDAYNILNDVTEKLYPNLENNRGNINLNEEINIKNNKDISSKMDEEIQNLQKNNKIYTSINTRCAAIVFIKIEEEYALYISPKEIVNYIINEVINTKKSLSKCISKFYPVEICTKYNKENFIEKVEKLTKTYFKNDIDNIKTWKIEIRVRNNNSVNKKEIMNIILNKINKDKYKVDYKHPELTFLVEISWNLMCLSVLEKFSEYKSYNIQSLAKTEEEIINEKNKLIKYQEEQKNKKEKKEEENKYNKLDNIIDAPKEDEDIDLI